MRTGRNDKERAAWKARHAAPPRSAPMGYDELRKLYLARLRQVVAAAAKWPAPERPAFSFIWFEPDRKRDPDNVRAGGTKLILDALVLAGVITGDGARTVDGFMGDVFVYGEREGVDVSAWTPEANAASWVMAVPFRLPDMNEMIAAARNDGILTERTRQARRVRT